MMKINDPLKTEVQTYIANSEQRAMDIIEEFKNAQLEEGYTLTKYNTTYKCKKDRKTKEIVEEYWLVKVTKEYEVM